MDQEKDKNDKKDKNEHYYFYLAVKIILVLIVLFIIYSFRKNILLYLTNLYRRFRYAGAVDMQRRNLLEDIDNEFNAAQQNRERMAQIEENARRQRVIGEAYEMPGMNERFAAAAAGAGVGIGNEIRRYPVRIPGLGSREKSERDMKKKMEIDRLNMEDELYTRALRDQVRDITRGQYIEGLEMDPENINHLRTYLTREGELLPTKTLNKEEYWKRIRELYQGTPASKTRSRFQPPKIPLSIPALSGIPRAFRRTLFKKQGMIVDPEDAARLMSRNLQLPSSTPLPVNPFANYVPRIAGNSLSAFGKKKRR
jgi:hypothetical protein